MFARRVDRLRQYQDLVREPEQLLVLLVLLPDRLPLLVRDHLTLGVGSVLADHHERREEDGLERDDHREEAEWIVLYAEPDPEAEPEDVDVDEEHRAGELRDLVRDSVLNALRSLFRVFEENRVRFERRKVGYASKWCRLIHRETAPFRRLAVCRSSQTVSGKDGPTKPAGDAGRCPLATVIPRGPQPRPSPPSPRGSPGSTEPGPWPPSP